MINYENVLQTISYQTRQLSWSYDNYRWLKPFLSKKFISLPKKTTSFKHSLRKSENRDFTVSFNENMKISSYLEKFLWYKTKILFIIDDFCTINECIIIYRDLDSFPQALHIILLGNLRVLEFMAPKQHDMWMNSRYNLWYFLRRIWATFSFICGW